MILASAARHFGKKCYLFTPRRGIAQRDPVWGFPASPRPGGHSESFAFGENGSGFASLSERPFLAPGGELDLIFLPEGISVLCPLCSLLNMVPGGGRPSCRLMNLSASFLPGAEISDRRLPMPRKLFWSSEYQASVSTVFFPSYSHQ